MEVRAEPSYVLRLSGREFNLITRALGLASGVDVAFKPEEVTEVAALNRTLLSQQHAHLTQLAGQAEAKLAKASGVE